MRLYSDVLNKPFDTKKELDEAEAAYAAEQKKEAEKREAYEARVQEVRDAFERADKLARALCDDYTRVPSDIYWRIFWH